MKTAALVTALLSAIIGAALLWGYKHRLEATVSGGPKIQVAVVTSDMALGETLTRDKLSTRGVPTAYLEARHIQLRDVESVLGARVRARLSAGETVLWSDLAIAGANSRDLAGLVLPTMRAISLPANSSLVFDGLLRPGDRVDVLFTTKNKETNESITRPLLQNLIVLATGQDMSQHGVTGGKRKIATVTLMAKPSEVETLVNARTTGTLSMSLRNVDDLRLLSTTSPETIPAAIPATKAP